MRVQRDRLRPLLARLRQTLWLRPLIYGGLALVGVSLGLLADALEIRLGVVVDESLASLLLSVLTASMLGVATFAVASMVSAYASVAQVATPRAFDLIVADDRSKTALSAFVASFVFATVGDVAVTGQILEESGRVVLFAQTLLVYFGVIVVFLRWVDAIARLGRVSTAIERVEAATADALDLHARSVRLGAAPPPLHGVRQHPVHASWVGYVTDVDLPALQRLAERHDVEIEIAVIPGAFVGPSVVVAWSSGALDDEAVEAARSAFPLQVRRAFDADPAYGFIVLSEIGCRALSPAVNDSGTAIEAIRSATRLLLRHAPRGATSDEPIYPSVAVATLDVSTLFDGFFPPVARDAADREEVVRVIRESLRLVAAEPGLASHVERLQGSVVSFGPR